MWSPSHRDGNTWEPVSLAQFHLQESPRPGPEAPTALGWSPGTVQAPCPHLLWKADLMGGEAV